MTTKSELQAMQQRWMEERRASGEPPTAEEMLAYTRGTLTAEQEARLQERLVAYPELLRTLTEPFPEGAEPGDPDYLSEAEFAEHWKKIRPRVQRPVPIVRPQVPRVWRHASFALAAMLMCVFGAFLWQMRSNIRLRNDLGPSVPGDEQMLYPDGRRGPASSADAITSEGDAFLLVPLVYPSRFPAYRLQLVDEARKKLWDSGSVEPRADEKFPIVIPHSYLDPGTYKFVLYGLEQGQEKQLATYSFRVPAR